MADDAPPVLARRLTILIWSVLLFFGIIGFAIVGMTILTIIFVIATHGRLNIT